MTRRRSKVQELAEAEGQEDAAILMEQDAANLMEDAANLMECCEPAANLMEDTANLMEQDAAYLISSSDSAENAEVKAQSTELAPVTTNDTEAVTRQHVLQQREAEKVTSILTLNLRGERIHMPLSELQKLYNTLYGKLFAVPHVNCPNGEIYYDADPMVFRLLLSFYRYGNMHLPSYICGPLLEKEMEFWGVKVTPECLEACCMHSALESKRWKVLLDEFEHKALEPPADDSLIALQWKTDGRQRFRPLWDMVNNPCSSVLSAVYSLVMIACSLTSAIMYTMEPPHACSNWGYRNQAVPTNCTVPESRADAGYVAAQCVFTFLFTFDLLVRALVAPNRAKFVRSAHTWNDVLSLVPLYGFLLHRMSGRILDLGSPAGWLFELLSVALFFRVFRILRHFIGIRVMAYTLMTGFSDLMVVMLLVFTATFLFGTVFFLMERSTKENRDKVPTMFHGYYWAVITITTVGYGDITPSTVEGRILSILCSLVGLIVVAFTVPILTENFQRYYGHTCHLSMRGELGRFVLKAKERVRRAKRKFFYSGF